MPTRLSAIFLAAATLAFNHGPQDLGPILGFTESSAAQRELEAMLDS